MVKIMLIHPSSRPENPGIDIYTDSNKAIPISVASLAASLRKGGHDVSILDCRLHRKKDIGSIIHKEMNEADCIGISAMTVQVKHGLQISKLVKSIDKDLPVIWGGIHPSLFPKQTCEDRHVDFVVVSEGEHAFLKFLDNLNSGRPRLEEIEGLAYKKRGKVMINRPGSLVDMDLVPMPAYDLLDMEKYIPRDYLGKKVKGIDILTSRGCPYRCAFCTNTIFASSRWRPRSSENVMKDINYLLEKYDFDHIFFLDDFFFGNVKRAAEIAKGIKGRRAGIKWDANVRCDNLSPNLLNDSLLKIIKESGCCTLRMGTESGSDRVLKMLKKDITTKQTFNAIRQCRKYGIIPMCFFMVGIPGEISEEMMETFRFMFRLRKINPHIVFYGPGIFRPYPGGELYDKCKELGFEEPKDLEGWARKGLDENYLNIKKLLWIDDPDLIKDLPYYFMLADAADNPYIKKSLPLKILSKVAGFRWKHDLWMFRAEPRIVQFYIKEKSKLESIFRNPIS